MEHIILCASLRRDGALEVHGLADVRVVLLTVFAGGILLDGLDVRGHLVLFLHDHRRVGGVQGAQCAQRGIDQIIAKLQVRERNSRIGFSLSRSRCSRRGIRSHAGSLCLRQLRERSGIRALNPGHIALRIKGYIRGLRAQPGFPRTVGLVGVRIRTCIVAFQIEHLIGLIDLFRDRIIDGDGAAVQRALLRSHHRAHGKNHDQRQQEADEFLGIPHNWFSFP